MASGEIIVNNLPANTSPTINDKVMVIRNADGELANVTLDDIGDLLADPPEVVWVTYGLTSQADIEAAYQAKKIVMMQSGGMDYRLEVRTSSTNHKFVAASGSTIYTKTCYNGSWSSSTSSIPSASSSNPEGLGIASPGVQNLYSRADHVHAMPSASDVGAIEAPASPSDGDVLTYDSTAGEWVAEAPGGGLTPAIKAALLQLAEKVVYVDDQGQTYYQALYDALYPAATTFTITNTLSNCTNSNSASIIAEGSSYSGTITAASGYTLTGATVSITMGGNDITATAYNAGTISIASVTGNLAISISAVSTSRLPSGYTEHDYIQQPASGWNNVISVPIQPKPSYTYELAFKVPSSTVPSSNAAPALIGTRASDGGLKRIALFCNISNSQPSKLGYWFATKDSTTTIPYTFDTVNNVKILPVGKSTTYPSNSVIVINGTEYSTTSTVSSETWESWFGLLGYTYQSTDLSSTTAGIGYQLGEVIIKDENDDIIYDFVPCAYGNSSVGFYEIVTGTYYPAASNYSAGDWA